MAKSSSGSLLASSPFRIFVPRGEALLFLFALAILFSIFLQQISATSAADFEGFDADEDEEFLVPDAKEDDSFSSYRTPHPSISLSTSTPEFERGPPDSPVADQDSGSTPNAPTTSSSSFDYWDEDEFEGIPQESSVPSDERAATESKPDSGSEAEKLDEDSESTAGTQFRIGSYSVEIVCVSFLIMFAINYFTGKRENENIAFAWASKFAVKDSIFDKNFSLLGVGESDGAPLWLKEGQNIFKFYASGRRFCTGLLATMELKSRHDLISKLYNMVIPCQDEITFEVYMNDDAMDHVIFALARKKLAKTMQKEVKNLQRFAALVAPPSGRKWVAEELQAVAESKEVAGDLVTDAVLDQVFGDKSFEKFGKGFISMHFSDQHAGSNKKMLVFKFALPDVDHMADMTRLVALVPYYIDQIGRYKLSSHARTKTEAARSKVAQEEYKELQNSRQEALQKKKAEQRKKVEEAEAKLSAEALRKKEAKERARQMKKAMPKLKMTRAH